VLACFDKTMSACRLPCSAAICMGRKPALVGRLTSAPAAYQSFHHGHAPLLLVMYGAVQRRHEVPALASIRGPLYHPVHVGAAPRKDLNDFCSVSHCGGYHRNLAILRNDFDIRPEIEQLLRSSDVFEFAGWMQRVDVKGARGDLACPERD